MTAEEMHQVLVTIYTNTAPSGPWADKAVHDYVASKLDKEETLPKSPYLIDILK